MKIKILKSSDPKYWYANKIGKEYVVKSIHNDSKSIYRCYVVRNFKSILRTVNINDAEIIEE